MSTTELSTRVDRLREPLLEAARLGFVAAEPHKLARQLLTACDRVLARLKDERADALGAWRRSLELFGSLEADQQAVELARGLRLCRALAGPAGPRQPRSESWSRPEAAPTHTLPGIGPALADRLAERGLRTVEDLMWLVPRRYDDVRRIRPLAEALADTEHGDRLTARGIVRTCRFMRRGRRRWVDMRLTADTPEDGFVVIRWFNAHGSMAKKYPVGTEVSISGRLTVRGGVNEMANPDVLGGGTANIIPRYPDIAGVPPATLRKACAAAVERGAGSLLDPLPAALARNHGLPSLSRAIRSLHAPDESLTEDEVVGLNEANSVWHRRLAFDDLFVLGLSISLRRQRHRSDRAGACPPVPRPPIEKVLPFSMTSAQAAATAAIGADMAESVPMNRLLQGDVGAGKTAVAFAACCQSVAAGRQVAFMAPTTILAEQHFRALTPWCEARGIRVSLLTAATPRGARASALSLLADGSIDILVGTHALIADSVQFSRLGLVIVDEQHRFGVAQRVRLRSKGDDSGSPHLLVMTATPIPRTLALTAYGDLDVTVIGELPPGRTPARTLVVTGQRGRETVYRRLEARLKTGERAFVVCPLVEPGEQDGSPPWRDATTTADELRQRLGPERVGLVHGRLAQAERDEAMAAFRDGVTGVLVATTVIEVGVDIPEATVMIVEDAQHFGLSQLHQLRGRVGRGGGECHCILLRRKLVTPEAERRLDVMAETTDGFRIAEEDLLIRGPGELFGVRQAGAPRLRFGDLRQHTELLIEARAAADKLLAESPELDRPEDALIKGLVDRLAQPAFGAEGG